ncbi:STAS domain-containing protein [Geobacter sp.]|uniref:STAS domain-containing protein n=1 Tax=Geobacter sp. TaxID=46610 RepID=UPI0026090254|nr:STAS domain-containing protein [Geobacter sp.]
METDFRVEVVRDGIADVIYFCGTIDAKAEQIMNGLSGQVRGPDVRCDFSGTGRINSMGIAFLLRFLKSLRDRKNVRVSLCGLNQMNAMLFKMTGIYLLATPEQ